MRLDLETNTDNWYFDEILVQPPEWGWSSWNCNNGKPKNFIRFIHNAGVGFTNWVDDGKWSYIPDKHTAVMDSNCRNNGRLSSGYLIEIEVQNLDLYARLRFLVTMLTSGIMQKEIVKCQLKVSLANFWDTNGERVMDITLRLV